MYDYGPFALVCGCVQGVSACDGVRARLCVCVLHIITRESLLLLLFLTDIKSCHSQHIGISGAVRLIAIIPDTGIKNVRAPLSISHT